MHALIVGKWWGRCKDQQTQKSLTLKRGGDFWGSFLKFFLVLKSLPKHVLVLGGTLSPTKTWLLHKNSTFWDSYLQKGLKMRCWGSLKNTKYEQILRLIFKRSKEEEILRQILKKRNEEQILRLSYWSKRSTFWGSLQ